MLRTGVALALLLAAVSIAAASTSARRPAPPVAGVALDGKRVSLAAMRGRPVFLNVWSSW